MAAVLCGSAQQSLPQGRSCSKPGCALMCSNSQEAVARLGEFLGAVSLWCDELLHSACSQLDVVFSPLRSAWLTAHRRFHGGLTLLQQCFLVIRLLDSLGACSRGSAVLCPSALSAGAAAPCSTFQSAAAWVCGDWLRAVLPFRNFSVLLSHAVIVQQLPVKLTQVMSWPRGRQSCRGWSSADGCSAPPAAQPQRHAAFGRAGITSALSCSVSKSAVY